MSEGKAPKIPEHFPWHNYQTTFMISSPGLNAEQSFQEIIANLFCRSLVRENTKSSCLKRLTQQKLVGFDVGKIL